MTAKSDKSERVRVQETFGQAIIDAITDFARRDIKSTDELESDHFSHVSHPGLRTALANTLYGSRWLYKLGLAVRASPAERLGLLRMQIIDYAAVCEALLKESIEFGIGNGLLSGQCYQYADFKKLRNAIDWSNNLTGTMERMSLAWAIAVASEEKIVSPKLGQDLDKVRKARNNVHITARARYNPDTTKFVGKTMLQTAQSTKGWRQNVSASNRCASNRCHAPSRNPGARGGRGSGGDGNRVRPPCDQRRTRRL